ncbi:MAG: ComEC/Rec2 family competence protein [Fimbriimonadaceae bacterium]
MAAQGAAGDVILRLTKSFAAVLAGGSLLAGAGYGLIGSTTDRVVFLAIGQGDATLLQSEGRSMLIDVGPAPPGTVPPVVAHLRTFGVDRVDAILLSHPDADHVAGLTAVMRISPDARIEIPECFEDDPKMVSVLMRAHVPPSHVVWTTGEAGRFGAFNVQVRCHSWRAGEDDNLGSMAVKVSEGAASLVTTGDGPASEEEDLLGKLDWSAEIIHFGHHGSKTSSSTAWLAAVHPVYGIVSCGLNNRYGHPNPQTLERAKAQHIEVHRTDLEGDLEFDVVHGRFEFER